MLSKDKAFWDSKKLEYPYHAIAPTSIKPDLVRATMQGDYACHLHRIGWRIWYFELEGDRDKLKTQFGGKDVV